MVRDDPAGEAELRIGRQYEPGPAVGLLRMADPGRRPIEHLLAEAERVLKIETADISAPDKVQVGGTGATPPEPQLLGGTCLGAI